MPRKSIFGENAQITTMRLYSWEKVEVRQFLREIREKKRNEIEQERKDVKNNKR